MRRFVPLLLLPALLVLGGCPGPQNPPAAPDASGGGIEEENTTTEEGTAKRGPVTAEMFVGAWTTQDSQGQRFDIVLFPNGQAVSNWMKGTAPALGERGFWRLGSGGVTIFYSDGWTDRISAVADGFLHQGFAPGTPIGSKPDNEAPATRVEGDRAGFVGIWRLNKEPDGNYLYISLHSSGSAMSTVNAEGTWTATGDGAHCVWPDGWNDLISRTEDGYKKRAWVGAAPDTNLPDFSVATRVGETKFIITP